MGQKFGSGLTGWSLFGGLLKLWSRCWPGLCLSEGLAGSGGSFSKVVPIREW